MCLQNLSLQPKSSFDEIIGVALWTAEQANALVKYPDLGLSEVAICYLKQIPLIIESWGYKHHNPYVTVHAFLASLGPREQDYAATEAANYLFTNDYLNKLMSVDDTFFYEITDKANQFSRCQQNGLRLIQNEEIQKVITILSNMGVMVNNGSCTQREAIENEKSNIIYHLVKTIAFLKEFDPTAIKFSCMIRTKKEEVGGIERNVIVKLTQDYTVQNLIDQLYPKSSCKAIGSGDGEDELPIIRELFYEGNKLDPNNKVCSLNNTIFLSSNWMLQIIMPRQSPSQSQNIEQAVTPPISTVAFPNPVDARIKNITFHFEVIFEQFEGINTELKKRYLIQRSLDIQPLTNINPLLTNTGIISRDAKIKDQPIIRIIKITKERQTSLHRPDLSIMQYSELIEKYHRPTDPNIDPLISIIVRYPVKSMFKAYPDYLQTIIKKAKKYQPRLSRLNSEFQFCVEELVKLDNSQKMDPKLSRNWIFNESYQEALEGLCALLDNMK